MNGKMRKKTLSYKVFTKIFGEKKMALRYRSAK